MQWLWSIVQELDGEEARRFLKFFTGSDRAPIGGLGNLRCVIQRDGADSPKLPTSHTCFNTLLLPAYRSRRVMAARLRLAIMNSEGFGYGPGPSHSRAPSSICFLFTSHISYVALLQPENFFCCIMAMRLCLAIILSEGSVCGLRFPSQQSLIVKLYLAYQPHAHQDVTHRLCVLRGSGTDQVNLTAGWSERFRYGVAASR